MPQQSPSPALFFDTINAYQRAEALRALKRHLARRVFHLLHSAQQAQHHQHQHRRGAA